MSICENPEGPCIHTPQKGSTPSIDRGHHSRVPQGGCGFRCDPRSRLVVVGTGAALPGSRLEAGVLFAALIKSLQYPIASYARPTSSTTGTIHRA